MTDTSDIAGERQRRFTMPAVPQDIANFLSRRVADQQLRCVVRLDGRVDADRLARAARLAVEAEPILGCRFAVDSPHPYWERRPNSYDESLLQLAEEGGSGSPLSAFLADPLDPTNDPLARVCVVRGRSEDVVAVKLSHVVSDIAGLRVYLALLTSLYRRLETEPAPRLERRVEVERGQADVLRAVPPDELRRIAAKMGGVAPAWGFPASGSDLHGAALATRRIAPSQLAALREYGRARGATVNDVFLAALFRALVAKLRPPSDVSLAIQMTVDLRRYLPDGRAPGICNLSGIVYPTITASEATTFDSTLAAVVRATSELKAEHPGLGTAAYLEGAFRGDFQDILRGLQARSGSASQGRAHPMLTNFGVLPEACVDFGGPTTTDAVLYGPVVYPPGFAMALSTFRDALTCSVAFAPGAVDSDQVEGVLDLVVAGLPTEAP